MPVKNRKIVTLSQISHLTGMSKSTIYQSWPKWKRYGVKPLTLSPNGSPRFFWDEIEKMLMAEK